MSLPVKAARENDTFARLFVNDFDVLENDALLSATSGLFAISLTTAHRSAASASRVTFSVNPVSPEDLVRRYASLAELGLPLQITEFDMSSGWSETAQKESMETILVTSFAEPAVSAFIMWGFWDGNHWLGNAPLYTRDWTLKPSGDVFMDYVFDRWWTSESAVTGADGVADIRGFKGPYDVTASFNGHIETQRVSLLEDSEIVFDLDQVRVSSEAAASFEAGIRSVYPMPFSDVMTIKAAIPTSTDVRFELHDLLGRLIWLNEARTLPAGEHEMRLTPDVPGSGTYLLQMHGWLPGGAFVDSKFVVVVR